MPQSRIIQGPDTSPYRLAVHIHATMSDRSVFGSDRLRCARVTMSLGNAQHPDGLGLDPLTASIAQYKDWRTTAGCHLPRVVNHPKSNVLSHGVRFHSGVFRHPT